MSLWLQCIARLKLRLAASDFKRWISPLQTTETQARLDIYAPNLFVLERVQSHYLDEILSTVASASEGTAPPIDVVLKVGSPQTSLPAQGLDGPLKKNPTGSSASTTTDRGCVSKHACDWTVHPSLDSSKTFQNFVVGDCNRLALTAAVRIAQRPGKQYNPLFLFGKTGLGKTHLLNAIGNELVRHGDGKAVEYIHAERFVQEMVEALQKKRLETFKKQYRSLKVLMLDDVQFFINKLRSQEELFHTLNELISGHQQVILAADCPPSQLNLPERLRSQLGSGLVIAVKPPALKTRVAILMQKATEKNATLTEECALLMAKRLHRNVRELEGALTRVCASAQFQACFITPPFVQEVLDELGAHDEMPSIGLDTIQKKVASRYQLSISDLLSRSRSRSLTRPRQMAMALAKQLTKLSLPEIGDAFGRRDHTTVLHACRQIRLRKQRDHAFLQEWNALEQTVVSCDASAAH